MAKVGEMQVVDLKEYGREGFAIELFSYGNDTEPYWAIPAWDERNAGDLDGPFVDRADAEIALREYRGWLQ